MLRYLLCKRKSCVFLFLLTLTLLPIFFLYRANDSKEKSKVPTKSVEIQQALRIHKTIQTPQQPPTQPHKTIQTPQQPPTQPHLCNNHSIDTKLILFYTPLFKQKPWMDIDSRETFLADCPTKKCQISYDERDIGKSDLAIFHAADMSSKEVVEKIHKDRCANQRMAYLSHENVRFTADISWAPKGFFNWTITFKRSSDFTIPYGHTFPLNPENKPQELKNYAAYKEKLVVWAVSHCGELREKYVQELVEHIKVDIYGGCSGVYGQNNDCPRNSPGCDALFKTYKFYLAFENSLCTDYITEKFWRTLNWKVVPIVLSTDDYRSVAPPGSFISVQDFPSVKALAEYLVYLDKNDTAYNEYFQWRQKFGTRRRNWFQFVACDMCDALQDDSVQHKSYDGLKSFWNVETDCEKPEVPILKILEESLQLTRNVSSEQT